MGVIKEYDYCLRCGRRLKNPDARKIGYGKICFQKIQQGKSYKLIAYNIEETQGTGK